MIIANDDIAPLLRKRIGEYATDIRSLEQASFKQFGSDHHKEVPIYYVPIHPKHRNKVDTTLGPPFMGPMLLFGLCVDSLGGQHRQLITYRFLWE